MLRRAPSWPADLDTRARRDMRAFVRRRKPSREEIGARMVRAALWRTASPSQFARELQQGGMR